MAFAVMIDLLFLHSHRSHWGEARASRWLQDKGAAHRRGAGPRDRGRYSRRTHRPATCTAMQRVAFGTGLLAIGREAANLVGKYSP